MLTPSYWKGVFWRRSVGGSQQLTWERFTDAPVFSAMALAKGRACSPKSDPSRVTRSLIQHGVLRTESVVWSLSDLDHGSRKPRGWAIGAIYSANFGLDNYYTWLICPWISHDSPVGHGSFKAPPGGSEPCWLETRSDALSIFQAGHPSREPGGGRGAAPPDGGGHPPGGRTSLPSPGSFRKV